jgi:hypothetical protein
MNRTRNDYETKSFVDTDTPLDLLIVKHNGNTSIFQVFEKMKI